MIEVRQDLAEKQAPMWSFYSFCPQSTCYIYFTFFFLWLILICICPITWLVLGNGTSECYYFHENCFLMGTVAKACLQGSDLLVQQHFRWVQLRWDSEPMQGLLQRSLRRKVVTKVTSPELQLFRRGHLVSGNLGLVLPFTNFVASASAIFEYSRIK